MKAILDHVGIAVKDLAAALAFYRDALGLEIEAPEEVASQRVRAHFVPVGESKLELLEATAPDSPIAKYIEKRGPGLHHITLRVDDIQAALAQLKARGARLIDEQPRPGAEGALVAFIHPASAHGVLVELKQAGAEPSAARPTCRPGDSCRRPAVHPRRPRAHLALRRLLPPRRRRDVRRRARSRSGRRRRRPTSATASRSRCVRWSSAARARCSSTPGWATRRTTKFRDIYGVERARHLDHTLAEAGLAPEDIDIVLATHLHFDHAGGFTVRDASGRRAPAVSPRPVRRPARRVGGCDASARAESRQLSGGQLRAARRGRRAAAGGRRSDDHARREGAADRRAHDAPPDGADRIGRQDARRSSPT